MLPLAKIQGVIRTDFDHAEAWDTIRALIRPPVYEEDNRFYACVDFVDDGRYRNQSVRKLLRELPHNYKHSFLRLEDTIERTAGAREWAGTGGHSQMHS